MRTFEEKLHLLELPELPGTNTGQPGVQEALSHHHVLLNEYRLGFGDLMAGLSPPDSDKLDQGFHRMVAADALMGMLFDTIRQRNEDYQRRPEEASTVPCPRCSSTLQPPRLQHLPTVSLHAPLHAQRTGGDGRGRRPVRETSPGGMRELRGLTEAWVNKDESQPLHDKLQTLLKPIPARGLERSQTVLAASDIDEGDAGRRAPDH